MYFLKCEHCTFYNPVKSQYLTFCERCGKKLTNNYRDWSFGGQKSVEEFYQTVCVTEAAAAMASTPPKQAKKKMSKMAIAGAILGGFAVVLLLTVYFGVLVYQNYVEQKTSNEVLESTWVRNTYGTLGLSLESPKKLEPGDLSQIIPENVKQLIKKVETYQYLNEKGFKIMINSIAYNPSVQPSLEGAANGSANEMKVQPGVSEFKFQQKAGSISGKNALIQEGTYIYNALTEIEFKNIVVVNKTHLWQVTIIYQSNDDVGRKACERVVQSIQIAG